MRLDEASISLIKNGLHACPGEPGQTWPQTEKSPKKQLT
jgi:hypothetical protein